jgi:hypothetical protein
VIWLVGVNGIITGTGHMFMPAKVAESIGWPTSRFQWEVGLADLSYGVAGVMAPSFDRGFWLATIVVFAIFMLGAAVGHVRSMIAEQTSHRATPATSSGTTSQRPSCSSCCTSSPDSRPPGRRVPLGLGPAGA